MATNADRYLRAWLPDRWRICGRRLQPLCLGHAMLLQRLGNSALPGEDQASPLPPASDLLLAVWLCSLRVDAACREIERGLSMRFRLWACIARAVTLLRPGIYLRSVMLWRAYLANSLDSPISWDSQADASRPLGTPWMAALFLRLLRLGYAPADVYQVPLAMAFWQLAAAREMAGDAEIVNDVEAAAIQPQPTQASTASDDHHA